ncbi:glycoside hydrolase family protein [Epibacterium sp. MM17-32]|uniref:glycosyl hydrolase n=1 Tax=Epibacterium sp. MM17-32 TaxID=2917734 RepID=UPI001EF602A0|nr:glycosyl hydrolase [Epibacterium sp. MM17-32]MCG7626211.1 glycoside hydrolase family protein [Epibacterium sp. MM17-32]
MRYAPRLSLRQSAVAARCSHMAGLLLVALVMMAASPSASRAQQAGVGAWENSDYGMMSWIERQPGLQWYYNWRADPLWTPAPVPRSVEFVPMIHSAKNVGDPIRSQPRPRALLGFNEPDGGSGAHQAKLSVKRALRLWPRLEAHGLRLGSPATTQGQTLGAGSWQQRFMQQVEARGLRVDFMAVHYYSTDGDVRAFRDWLIAVHRTYGRPIWVTEFAHIDWRQPARASYRQNARFAREASRMMDGLAFVERYAWFAANPYPWNGRVPEINLVSDALQPTPVGAAYLKAIRSRGPRLSALQ